ncbi:hypothetical protein BH20ACT9_BH20ACT9_21250 [soil metagenome]
MSDQGRMPTGQLTAAMVWGITGGVIGIIAAFLVIVIGGIGEGLEAAGARTRGGAGIAGLGFAAVFLAVLGIVGGALARARPMAAAITQLVAGVGGFIAVSAAWLVSGPLLLVGAVLAFTGARTQARRTPRVD